jgi:non-homologous end joining protein Ku
MQNKKYSANLFESLQPHKKLIDGFSHQHTLMEGEAEKIADVTSDKLMDLIKAGNKSKAKSLMDKAAKESEDLVARIRAKYNQKKKEANIASESKEAKAEVK